MSKYTFTTIKDRKCDTVTVILAEVVSFRELSTCCTLGARDGLPALCSIVLGRGLDLVFIGGEVVARLGL